MDYANIDLFRLSKGYKVDEDLVGREINKYKTNGQMQSILTNNDYDIIEGAEAYIAGKKLGLKYLESSRVKAMRKSKSVFPSGFLLEITSRCTLRCIMCPRNQLMREEKDMDIKVVKKIIDEISLHQIEGLWLYNVGEPMLHHDFFEILEYVGKYSAIHPLWISTNGTTLTEANAKKLLDSKLDYLNFSLNALTEKAHEIISRQSAFRLIMENLNNFLIMKRKMNKRKPFLRVQIIDQPEVHDQVGRFIEEWGSKADIISINKLETFIGQKEIPSNKDLDEFLNNVGPCRRIDRGILYIFSNNKVGICATDFNCVNCVGDVSAMTIKEIWTGAEYKRLYRNIKSKAYGKIPFCYACRDRELA